MGLGAMMKGTIQTMEEDRRSRVGHHSRNLLNKIHHPVSHQAPNSVKNNLKVEKKLMRDQYVTIPSFP